SGPAPAVLTAARPDSPRPVLPAPRALLLDFGGVVISTTPRLTWARARGDRGRACPRRRHRARGRRGRGLPPGGPLCAVAVEERRQPAPGPARARTARDRRGLPARRPAVDGARRPGAGR